MDSELNENTVDEYTDQLDKWACNLFREINNILSEYNRLYNTTDESDIVTDKDKSELEVISYKAVYFFNLFKSQLRLFETHGGFFIKHLGYDKIISPEDYMKIYEDIELISGRIDNVEKGKYILKNKEEIVDVVLKYFPLNLDFEKYESLLAQKMEN
ncbi:MAG: hypothetical protein KAS11_04485 [Candidatus Aenigmarchaeota archaeon]|nr:hypothetical protein [Candidatus Aenigmarchaeota archaeon]